MVWTLSNSDNCVCNCFLLLFPIVLTRLNPNFLPIFPLVHLVVSQRHLPQGYGCPVSSVPACELTSKWERSMPALSRVSLLRVLGQDHVCPCPAQCHSSPELTKGSERHSACTTETLMGVWLASKWLFHASRYLTHPNSKHTFNVSAV